jgi:hypothetical protein
MIDRHVHFEVLCVLASSGQLSPLEEAELRDHASGCAICVERVGQFTHLSSRLFLAEGLLSRPQWVSDGMKERFEARAVREGIPLHPRTPKRCLNHVLGVAATLLVATLTIAATLPGDSVFRRAFQTGASKKIYQVQALSKSANPGPEIPRLTQPESVNLSAHSEHRPSVSRTQNRIQIAFASEENRAAAATRHFSLGRYLPSTGTWSIQRYASFAPASRPGQADALFTVAYVHPAYVPRHDLGDFPGVGASGLSQLWTDSRLADKLGSNGGAFAHPAFTFNVAVTETPEQDRSSSLDLDAYVPNAKAYLNGNIPRFHLLQNAAD